MSSNARRWRRPTVAAAFGLILVCSNPLTWQQSADVETVPYFVADGSGRTGYRDGDRELAAWALAAWQRSAGTGLRFETAPESRALVRVYWADPADGQYGEMVPFLVGDRRGAAVYIRPDTGALGPDIARQARLDPLLRDSIVYLTCLHELGHALGLRHTDMFADIMYSFQFGGDIPGTSRAIGARSSPEPTSPPRRGCQRPTPNTCEPFTPHATAPSRRHSRWRFSSAGPTDCPTTSGWFLARGLVLVPP